MCSYYFISVSVAEQPPFGKKLLTRLTIWLTICSLCILTICSGSITSVGEERANLSAVVYL